MHNPRLGLRELHIGHSVLPVSPCCQCLAEPADGDGARACWLQREATLDHPACLQVDGGGACASSRGVCAFWEQLDACVVPGKQVVRPQDEVEGRDPSSAGGMKRAKMQCSTTAQGKYVPFSFPLLKFHEVFCDVRELSEEHERYEVYLKVNPSSSPTSANPTLPGAAWPDRRRSSRASQSVSAPSRQR